MKKNNKIKFSTAIKQAMFDAMKLDKKVIIYGLGVGTTGNIYGTTSLDCCVLDWTIIKYVIPLFLIIGLIVYIIFKVKSRI